MALLCFHIIATGAVYLLHSAIFTSLKKKNPEKVQLYARSEGYPCFDRAGGVLWVQTGRLWCLELLSMRKKLVANFQPDFQMRQLLRIYKKVV